MIKYFITILALLLLPNISHGALNFTPSDSDLSVTYLRMLFGNIEGVLYSTGTQIMGRIFSIFNFACLSVGGMILLYVLVTEVINTANTGQALGGGQQNKMWLPIRAIIGLALLLPKGSGYNTMQAIMMWIILQGVGFANSVWEEVLSYLKQGGTLVENTVTPSSNSLTMDGDIIKGYARDYLKAATCVKAIQNHLEKQIEADVAALNLSLDGVIAAEQAGDPNATDISGRTSADLQQAIDDLSDIPNFDNTIVFPSSGLNAGSSVTVNFPGEFSDPYYTQTYEGVCGTSKIASSGSSKPEANSIKMLANEDLYSAMSGIADTYIDSDYDKVSGEYDSMGLAVLEYYYKMKAGEQYFAKENNSSETNFIDGAKSNGWIAAGAYYYKMVQISNKAIDDTTQYKKVTLAIIKSPISEPTTIADEDKGELLTDPNWSYIETKVLLAGNGLDSYINTDGDPDDGSNNTAAKERYKDLVPDSVDAVSPDIATQTKFYATIIAYLGAMVLVIVGVVAAASPLAGALAAAAMALSAVKIYLGFTSLFDGSSNPIVSLSLVGAGLMDMGVTLWVVAAIGVFIGTLAGSVLAGWNPFPFAAVAASAFIAPFITLFVGFLITTGGLLHIYVPLIPAIVFIFAALGWFMHVLEAMVAAPLICLGLMHPEGHAIWGKSESAIMLILNVFLRPALLIVGFVVASMLSYVGIWLINKIILETMFETVFSFLPGPGVAFALPLIILAYGSVCIWILQAVFELIPKLSDEVLKWIGGQQTSYSTAPAAKAGQLQGAVSGAASQIGGAAGSGMKGGSDVISKGREAEPEETKVSGDGDGGDEVHAGNDPGIGSNSTGGNDSRGGVSSENSSNDSTSGGVSSTSSNETDRDQE